MIEEWKPINNSDTYEISNLGRVRSKRRVSIDKNGKPQTHPEKYLTIMKLNNNMPFFKISEKSWTDKRQISLITCLAETFLDYNKDKDVVYTYGIDKESLSVEDILIDKNSDVGVLYTYLGDDFVEIEKGYFLSQKGELYSMDRFVKRSNGTTEFKKGKKIEPNYNNSTKYYQYRVGKNISKTIHRLVAETFIPNPNNFPCVNHIDGDKSNNCVENLEWCSYSDNLHHAYDTLKRPTNATSIKKRPCKSIKKSTEEVSMYESIAEASRNTGVSETQIRRIIANECINKVYNFEYI